MRLSEQIKKKRETPYQKVARICGCSEDYVGRIARGERTPNKKIGKKVQEQLNLLIED
jgi:uncharacterized protein YdbL (DUF1318 family)